MRCMRSRIALAALILAGCSAAGAPAARQPMPPRAAPLSAAQLDTIAEIMRLEDRREFSAERFTRWVQMTHPEVRSRALVGAGRIGDLNASRLIMLGLADTTRAVQASAAFALGQLRDSSDLVLQMLANASRQSDGIGIEAIASLGRIAHPASFAVIETLLSDPAAPADLRDEALLALARFPRRPNTLELALPFMSSPQAGTRWRALYALTRGNIEPRGVPNLIGWLADADPEVRALAARGLRAVTADSSHRRPEAMDALRRALADPHPHVRINAARSLSGYGDPVNVAVFLPLLSDPNGNVILAGIESLAANGGADQVLGRLADGNGHIGLRNAALNALARSPAQPSAFAAARARLGDASWLERLFALRILNNPANPSRNEEARSLMGDPDPRVAAAALDVLAADTVTPAYALFIEKLNDADPGVRASALRGLRRRATPADLEFFLRAYERAQQDPDTDAADAAVDALGALARQGVPVERSFFLRFKKPPHPGLHARIARAIGPGDWGPLRPLDPGRSQEFYRSAARRFLGGDSAASYPRLRFRTAAGEFIVELNGRQAPLTVLNFITLAERGFFNNTRWHRVVPNFVLQDGDARGDGSGGSPVVLRDEINRLRYERGALGMALSGPDTGTSQFFITHSPQPHLDGGYTVFGRVISGMEVADRVVQDDPLISIEVIR